MPLATCMRDGDPVSGGTGITYGKVEKTPSTTISGC